MIMMQLLAHLVFITTLSVFVPVNVAGKSQTIYLNSRSDCNGDAAFTVSVYKDYIVKPDANPHTKSHSFRDCEVIFGSERPDGHVCLALSGSEGIISDSNIKLEAKDGDPDDDTFYSLTNTHPWLLREHCSKSPFITLYLSQLRKLRYANIRKVNIQFKILDIESKDRELYLDGDYCSGTYKLKNSMVTLWNRPQFPGMRTTSLTSECPIHFDMMGRSHNTNKSICFAYIPSENMNCDSDWRFVISATFSVDEEDLLYSMRCNHSEAKNIHVLCVNPNLKAVMGVLWRKENILSNSTIEPSKDFRYIVMDYEGSEESLLKKVKHLYSTSSSSSAGEWMVYTIAAVGSVVFILLVVGVFVCCKRSYVQYKGVDLNDASKAM